MTTSQARSTTDHPSPCGRVRTELTHHGRQRWPLLCLLLALGVSVGASEWSPAITLVENHGRLAIGNQLHVVGHSGGNLVHRRSSDGGDTWTSPSIIATAAGNYPMQYGGLSCMNDTVYLLTAAGDMGPAAQHLDVRISSNNGLTWSAPRRITADGQQLFRAQLVARGSYIHVGGQGAPSSGTSWYFRSADGGVSWEPGRLMASGLGLYGGGQTIAVEGATVHLAYTATRNGPGAGDTKYCRSTDNGTSWSAAITIGENTASSDRQARIQLEADNGRVFASWQREASVSGGAIPADRLGYNTSSDGGETWGQPRILPYQTGVDRNHQQTWMSSGGDVHIIWRSGDTTDDPTGYLHSGDYGQTWSSPEIAIDTNNAANHPYSLVADTQRVHALVGPSGAMQYAHRAVPLSGNSAPTVSAGMDLTVTMPAAAALAGSVTDDGLPTGSSVTSTWTMISGPGIATFASPANPMTSATFSSAGTYVLRLSATDGSLDASDEVQITVGSATPTATITATDATASEAGPTTGTLTVTLSAASVTATTVALTWGGTASAGDCQPLPAGVTIAAGSLSGSVTVTSIDDALIEGDETVIASVTAGTGYTVGAPASATVTVTDNDSTPVVSVLATDAAAAETGPGTGTWTVSLSNASASAVTVTYAMSGRAGNGVDYQTLSGSVTIPALATTATVVLTPIEDTTYEKDETAILTLTGVSGATVGTASATVTIADNDGLNQPLGTTLTISPTPSVTVMSVYGAPTNAEVPADLTSTWNWGDGTTATSVAGTTSSHSFATPGTYTVTVTITDPANGQSLTGIHSVAVAPASSQATFAAGGIGGGGGGKGGCGLGSGLAGVFWLLGLGLIPVRRRSHHTVGSTG